MKIKCELYPSIYLSYCLHFGHYTNYLKNVAPPPRQATLHWLLTLFVVGSISYSVYFIALTDHKAGALLVFLLQSQC